MEIANVCYTPKCYYYSQTPTSVGEGRLSRIPIPAWLMPTAIQSDIIRSDAANGLFVAVNNLQLFSLSILHVRLLG